MKLLKIFAIILVNLVLVYFLTQNAGEKVNVNLLFSHFENVPVIVLILITSNIVLFRKIRNGSILIYLSTPITKTKIMSCGFLASLFSSFLVLFFLHATETIVTSLINSNIKENDLRDKVSF